jgi:hypothetical protein
MRVKRRSFSRLKASTPGDLQKIIAKKKIKYKSICFYDLSKLFFEVDFLIELH